MIMNTRSRIEAIAMSAKIRRMALVGEILRFTLWSCVGSGWARTIHVLAANASPVS